jgi:hypothetical protein
MRPTSFSASTAQYGSVRRAFDLIWRAQWPRGCHRVCPASPLIGMQQWTFLMFSRVGCDTRMHVCGPPTDSMQGLHVALTV